MIFKQEIEEHPEYNQLELLLLNGDNEFVEIASITVESEMENKER